MFTKCSFVLSAGIILWATSPALAEGGGQASAPNPSQPPQLDIQLQTIHSGYDRKTCWVHARAGMIPGTVRGAGDPFTAVLTMHALRITGSDVYYPIHDMRTDDGGKTWTGPTDQSSAFGRRPMPGGAATRARRSMPHNPSSMRWVRMPISRRRPAKGAPRWVAP